MATVGGRGTSGWSEVVALPGFRRLLAVRLVGQAADGLLQVGVAGFVFFSPERAAQPAQIAAGLAVLLLPYSVLGPFVGVLLDRWSRRQVLLTSNALRAAGLTALAALVVLDTQQIAFYLLALAVLGLNRFVLAALGASLPMVVPERLLVTANALAPSAGTLATALGAGAGVALRTVAGGADQGSAAALVAAACVCVLAAALALLLGRAQLGPERPVQVTVRNAVVDVVRGLVDGLRHVSRRPLAARALLVLTGMRVCYGVGFVWIIVLFRNQFYQGNPDAALAALGLVVLALGAGVFVAAALTPSGTRHLGTPRWSSLALLVAAATQLAVGVAASVASVTTGALLLATSSQSVKIGVDSTLQSTVADDYRGRVFSVYDLLFNASFVLAAAVAAIVLPEDGDAPAVIALVATGYLLLGLWYGRDGRRDGQA